MGERLEGRRVANVGDLEQPGDYCLRYAEDPHRIAALWFILPVPDAGYGRIAGLGGGDGEEPEWTITEDAEGKVTVEPSIHLVGVWHGFLRGGVWES